MARARITRRRSKSSPWKGTIRLAVVFAGLIGVNAYFFAFRHGTSLPDLRRLSEQHEMVAITSSAHAAGAAPGTANPPSALGHAASRRLAEAPSSAAPSVPATPTAIESSDEGRLESGTVVAGDTLTSLMRRAGVPAGTISAVIATLSPRFDPTELRTGHEYALRFDAEDRLRSLELRITPSSLYTVDRGALRGDTFRAGHETAPLSVRVTAIGGTLDGSLYDGVKRAQEGPALAAAFADALAPELNLDVDATPASRFKLVVEKLYLGDRFWRYGRLLALELSNAGGVVARAFWFSPAPGSGGYYTERGEALLRSPLRSPLRYVRLPAGFDARRMRPALHTEEAHLGSDWTAPAGTPVMATADGRIGFAGSRAGEGECVVVAHPGGMETSYAHLQRLARGLEVGQPVREKQVIGYVGQSGLPAGTAAHLHYGARVGPHWVDPLRLKQVRQPALAASVQERFASTIAPLQDRLAKVEIAPPARASTHAP